MQKGIESYEILNIEEVVWDKMDTTGYWVKLKINTGSGRTKDGYMFLIKTQNGNIKLKSDGLSDWWMSR